MWKITSIVLAVTVVFVLGFAFLQKSSPKTQGEVLSESEAASIQIDSQLQDWGQVPINGGVITKEFVFSNPTEKTLLLKKIVTSCMCTTAAVEVNGKSTRFFGMEMSMDKNPPVNMEIPAGASAKAIVRFDPAAHGPEGVGPFERTVQLVFTDPVGIREINFKGEVVR